ncbi:MAG: ribulose-phosphate 3-epimerase [Anaerolineae bacterium]|nr:ribulose-phosphate 3-epimerase [Anaerolineae bacterium]MCA9896205.1 ribulose-phosphate 3-epimerase [Anaerolineae bacterium]
MANQIKIAPSILAADFTKLGEQIAQAEQAGADWLHFDVMDGRFVPNISMGLPVLRSIKRVATVPIDVHLMIVEPERYVAEFAKAGASSISVHIEASPHLHRTLTLIKDSGCRVGVAINPHTPASFLSEILHLLDIINVMTVNPGFGGQSFLEFTTSKISELRSMASSIGKDIDIEVDGGINVITAPIAVEAGANVLIAGTTIFNHEQSIKQGIDELRAAATR